MSVNPKQNSFVKIYIAAALFSPAERQFNEELCSTLEQNYSVYLPQRDGILIELSVVQGLEAVQSACRTAYHEDIAAIRGSNVIVAVLDGRALDEGVCIEIGYAKALGKIIVGYKSDIRTAPPWGHNPLISGCIDAWARNINELELIIRQFVQTLSHDNHKNSEMTNV